jgi:dTDP-4-amino-4,6-dideoxygalactose transaminase
MDSRAALPFALPDIGEEEILEVVDSLRSGWLTTGIKSKKFEENFSDFIGVGVDSIAVNSATAGMHLALEALGIKSGDEVITTPYTFTATAEVIRYLGAEPVFVDIDPKTLNIGIEGIAAAITKRTKAILPVHFAGLPCDMDSILLLAKQYNLKVIEDAAHALPAEYKGTIVGGLQSDAAVFSFYATKTITTGEGGMICTRNKEIASRCRTMRLHGISKDVFGRYTAKTPSWFYEVIAPGFKYNLTDIAASIGIHQLAKADLFRKQRTRIAKQYNAAFKGLPVTLPPDAPKSDMHAWHLYVIRLKPDSNIDRDTFIESMSEKGIGCSVHFIPLHIQPYWRDRYSLKPEDFPVAMGTFESVFSLPIYTKMTDEDVERVIKAVKELLLC